MYINTLISDIVYLDVLVAVWENVLEDDDGAVLLLACVQHVGHVKEVGSLLGEALVDQEVGHVGQDLLVELDFVAEDVELVLLILLYITLLYISSSQQFVFTRI